MNFNTFTNLVRNIASISFLLIVFSYHKDEPTAQDEIISTHQNEQLKRYKKKLLQNRVHAGFLKCSTIRLEQTANDSREL